MNDGSKDFERIKARLAKRLNALAEPLGEAVLLSIRDGSPVTGSAGQPEKSGRLKRSWKFVRRGAKLRVFSALFYAPFAEEGKTPKGGKFIQRSRKGGPHSVKQTRANVQRLVDRVVDAIREQDNG